MQTWSLILIEITDLPKCITLFHFNDVAPMEMHIVGHKLLSPLQGDSVGSIPGTPGRPGRKGQQVTNKLNKGLST